MAVYRKKLVDKDGNTIVPAIGDIYGPIYDVTLDSASGGLAYYSFTPDTPVEVDRVYAVRFPDPDVYNATVLLTDGTIGADTVLVPQASVTDQPQFELLDTNMINSVEVFLLMYNGVQWLCLNQKKKTTSSDFDWDTIYDSDSGWYRFDLGKIHFLAKAQTFSSLSKSWQTIGTVPSDLKSGELVFFRWTGKYGNGNTCLSYSAQMDANGVIKATIDSPGGNNGGYSFAIIVI